jgi:hypothetical protein
LILFARAPTHADGPNNLTTLLERNATREDHHAAVIRNMNPKELFLGLTEFRKFFGRDVKRARRPGLIDRDVNAPNPRTIHPDMRNQIAARVYYRDIHRLLNFPSFLFGGGNDSPCVGKRNHRRSSKQGFAECKIQIPQPGFM